MRLSCLLSAFQADNGQSDDLRDLREKYGFSPELSDDSLQEKLKETREYLKREIRKVSNISLASWSTGEPAHWSTGEPAHWSTGEPAHWSTRQSAHWSTGEPAHWSFCQSAH